METGKSDALNASNPQRGHAGSRVSSGNIGSDQRGTAHTPKHKTEEETAVAQHKLGEPVSGSRKAKKARSPRTCAPSLSLPVPCPGEGSRTAGDQQQPKQ